MRTVAILVVICLCCPPRARGQSVATATDAAEVRKYHLLREDDDWRFLAEDGHQQEFWDPIKYVRLREERDDWFLSMGGEARGTWERIDNDNWGQQPFANSFGNQRYMFHVDVHYGGHVRSFVELKSGLNAGRTGGPRPIDKKKLDVQTAFAEVGTGGERTWIAARVGRHDMEYGSGRLIDVREGPNVRLSFDGFRVKSGVRSWQIDGFAVRPVLDKPGVFDNSPDHTVGFWGVYGVHPLANDVTLDAYYLGLDRQAAEFNRGIGHEKRHSVGARVSRPVAQTKPGWDFDYEALWQFGSFGPADIRAWTAASETGFRLPTLPLKPRFSAKADISSGDDGGSHALGTFNALFPKGNYFGVLATTGPGPINFIDAHPHIEAALPRDVTVSVDWIFQWRESVRDGVYAVPGFLIVPAGRSNARFVGHRPGTEVRWQANRHVWFQADYGIFYAGRFVTESQPARDLKYGALWAGYKF